MQSRAADTLMVLSSKELRKAPRPDAAPLKVRESQGFLVRLRVHVTFIHTYDQV